MLAQHLDRVVVHVEVVEVALLDAVERAQLGQDRRREPETVGQLEPLHDPVRHQQPAQLGEDALAGGIVDGVRGLEREPLGARVRREAQLGGQPHEPQRAERVGGVRGGLDAVAADHPQRAPLQVGDAALRIDRLAPVERHGDRVDAEVAPAEVLLDRRALERRDVEGEAVVPRVHAPGPEPLR
jgi:hypothetical protein